MASLGDRLQELGTLDRLACQDSPVHRLDPRAKVGVTLVFILLVASWGRYTVQGLLPFALFPVFMGARAGIPARLVLRRALLVLPFALVLGASNPVLDRSPVFLAGLPMAGGWLSYASILLRSLLCASAAVLLMATTSMEGVCWALERLGLPRVFAAQIGLLYRYLFVLLEEALRVTRARELRAHGRALVFGDYGPLVGNLLLRTWERGRRIHTAMLARGFEGALRTGPERAFTGRDWTFLLGWVVILGAMRLVDIPAQVGRIFGGAG
nr:cobalt ECF transporter T component CbiQ [uncultured Holophaga sp.]